jgi:hypothetical protein
MKQKTISDDLLNHLQGLASAELTNEQGQTIVLAQRELEVCLRGVSDGKGQGESLTTL